MSLNSWKKEFYHTPANRVSKGWALRHSILKWTGLLRRNRRKHRVILDNGTLYDDSTSRLDIDCKSCALCFHHSDNECKTCPVRKTGKTCHHAYYDMYDNKIAPMLRLLKKAKTYKKGTQHS